MIVIVIDLCDYCYLTYVLVENRSVSIFYLLDFGLNCVVLAGFAGALCGHCKMDVAECSNKRSASFTSTEETRLVELVKKYKHIVECKVSDTKTNQKKPECWDTIVKEFNGTVGLTYWPQNVLRKKYDIKKRVKRKFAEEKTYIRGTGGGPPKEAKFTDLDTEVRELLGARIEGFPSQFSNDAEVNGVDGPSCSQESTKEPAHIKIKTPMMAISPATVKKKLGTGPSWGLELLKEAVSEVPYNPDLIPVENVELEASEEDCIEQSTNVFAETAELKKEVEQLGKDSDNKLSDWSKYTLKMLKEKKSSALQIRKTGSTTKNNNATVNKVCQWATVKAAVEEFRKSIMEKEHDLKLKHMQEKNEMELQLMKLKSSVEIKHMEEVHAENMRILKSRHDV